MVNLGDGSKYFRESFRGFNREDVINFVTKMIKEYSENEEKYREVIAETTANLTKKTEEMEKLTKELENLKADLRKKALSVNEIQEKYSKLHEEYKRSKAAVESMLSTSEETQKDTSEIEEKLNSQVSDLSQQLGKGEAEKTFLLDVIKKFELETGLRISDICDRESLESQTISFENNMIDMEEARKKIEAFEREIAAVRKENEELNELRAKSAETPQEEQKIYEAITSDLGNVIYTAKKTAENIVGTANSEAESIMSKATSDAEDIMNQANMKRTLFFEEYERDVFKLKEKYRELKDRYAKIMEIFKDSYETYSLELLDVENDIENIYNKL